MKAASVAEAAEQILRTLLAPETNGGQPFVIDAVGIRVVHGGPQFTQPCPRQCRSAERMRGLTELAPLHTPGDVRASRRDCACCPMFLLWLSLIRPFTMTCRPKRAQYALPRELAQQHDLRRYGFHGISYRYVSERLLLAWSGKRRERG